MRVAIIEDEGAAARRLERLLAAVEPAAEVLGHWASVAEAVDALRDGAAPELVFLDIELGDGLGFEIAEQTPLDMPVIFTTAYDAYALRAFELDSIDYLLKPIRRQRLATALERYRRRRVRSLEPELVATLRASLAPSADGRFLVRRGKRLYSVPEAEVAYLYRDELVYLVTQKGERFALDLSLERASERLDRVRFRRLDRRFVASLEAVREIVVLPKSRLLVHLEPKPPFDPIVSQEKAAGIKTWLGQ
ncbi:MAG: LytTR family DNA-binding domain-containing protein [Acidobacteriota bacterium]